MRITDKVLVGLTVIGSDGHAIGEVATIFIDDERWKVESFQIKLRKEAAEQLGTSGSIFRAPTLEVPTRLVKSVRDAVVLDVPVDGLRQVLSSDTHAP